MSDNISLSFKEKIFPLLGKDRPVMLLIIDNLRLDQWKSIQEYITPLYNNFEEAEYFSILPTTTQYARNSIFSGMLPLEISKFHPEYWKNDNEIHCHSNTKTKSKKTYQEKFCF